MKNSSNIYRKITKKYTKTFYYSTLFFPQDIRDKIFLLYSFVRIIDNFVDKKKPDKKNFFIYKNELRNFVENNKVSKIKIINDFGKLVKEYNLKKEVYDYLLTQEKEIKIKKYKTFDDFLNFTYGVAGVIGIMIAKILKLPKNSYEYAKKLGQSLQIINNIRDIYEDSKIKKIYIPREVLNKFNLNHKNFLKKEKRKNLYLLINYFLNYAFKIQNEAKTYFKYFDKQILLPIKVATDLYKNIGLKISKNPEIIFNKSKVKPSKLEIFLIVIKNFILIYGFNKKN
ncbi:MAG: phytoene synthase [Patescibacteria group bacterium]|nr:MAG: phytoene synthase [Patescibacteria group bacterium]